MGPSVTSIRTELRQFRSHSLSDSVAVNYNERLLSLPKDDTWPDSCPSPGSLESAIPESLSTHTDHLSHSSVTIPGFCHVHLGIAAWGSRAHPLYVLEVHQLLTASNATRQSQANVTLRAARAPVAVTEVARTSRPVAPQFNPFAFDCGFIAKGSLHQTPNMMRFRVLLRKPVAL
jgi:hypothetical protein